MQLRIDIVSDVVCPWCIVGYKKLQLALHQFGDALATSIHWQPFELNPGMPEEGQDIREHMAQKYGATAEQSRSNRDALSKIGEALDFDFNYADDMRIYNTFRAHQLLHWAGELGKQTELQLALFKAYFTDGKNVSDVAVLTACAEDVGLPGEDAKAILNDGRFAETVRQVAQQWQARDIFAVPTFIFNGQYQVSGAQEPDKIARVINKLRDNVQSA